MFIVYCINIITLLTALFVTIIHMLVVLFSTSITQEENEKKNRHINRFHFTLFIVDAYENAFACRIVINHRKIGLVRKTAVTIIRTQTATAIVKNPIKFVI